MWLGLRSQDAVEERLQLFVGRVIVTAVRGSEMAGNVHRSLNDWLERWLGCWLRWRCVGECSRFGSNFVPLTIRCAFRRVVASAIFSFCIRKIPVVRHQIKKTRDRARWWCALGL
jgi:hypothetical protein